MANKNDYNYFKNLAKSVGYGCEASKILCETLKNYDIDELPEKLEVMHKIEHTADIDKHEMMSRLVREFITPIEREDIISLAQEIDDVTDTIEDVLIRMYMFNVKNLRAEALDFCEIIIKSCDALKKAMDEFHNFRKSTVLHEYLVEINHLEELGDKIYTDATHRLFVECDNPIEILTWKETFDRFEKCCDACEEVADVIEGVIMKNS